MEYDYQIERTQQNIIMVSFKSLFTFESTGI